MFFNNSISSPAQDFSWWSGRVARRTVADYTIVWTSPTGQVYRTTAGGADLFPQF
jgi:hypothetical protein